MTQPRYPVRRTSLRYSFFADAEVTLRDGTSVRGQLEELSARGCYIDTLQPIPPSTKLNIRICDGTSTCEVHGKVLYLHSGGGLGVFGMGVLFEEMRAEQNSTIGTWLRGLAAHRTNDSANNP
jgi:PilZ domain